MLYVSSNRSSIYVELIVEAIYVTILATTVQVSPSKLKISTLSIYFSATVPIRERFITWIKLCHLSCFMSTHLTRTLFYSALQITAQAPKWCQLTSMKKRSSHFWNPFKGLPFQLIATLDRNEKLGEKFCIKRWTSTNPSSNSIKPVFCSLLTIPRLFYEEKVWWGQIWELF